MIWDDRKLTEPLKVNKLDGVSNVAILHYDDDNNTMYVVDKGSRSWHTHYYTDNNGPLFTKMEDSMNKENTIGMYFLPKRIMDVGKNELNRAWRLTVKNAEQFSFKVPRKGGGFSEELYPPCFAGQSATTYEAWAGGENKDPVVQNWDTTVQNAAQTQQV